MRSLHAKILFGLGLLLGAHRPLHAAPPVPSPPPPVDAADRNPYLAGALAEVFPGAGYFYLGDESRGWLSAGLIVPMSLGHYVTPRNWSQASLVANLRTTSRNLFGYTVYDSYQSALSQDERERAPITHPHYSFRELALAPWDSANYQSWKVLVPLGLVGLGVAGRLSQEGISPRLTAGHALLAIPMIALQTMLIGMGEESEFRGFQYPAFAKLTGSAALGNILQATSFGLCHTRTGLCASPYLTGHLLRATATRHPDRAYAAPSSPSDGGDSTDLAYFIDTFLYGLYWGWVSREDRGLLYTVTTHAVTDGLLILTDLLTTANTGRIYLSVGFTY